MKEIKDLLHRVNEIVKELKLATSLPKYPNSITTNPNYLPILFSSHFRQIELSFISTHKTIEQYHFPLYDSQVHLSSIVSSKEVTYDYVSSLSQPRLYSSYCGKVWRVTFFKRSWYSIKTKGFRFSTTVDSTPVKASFLAEDLFRQLVNRNLWACSFSIQMRTMTVSHEGPDFMRKCCQIICNLQKFCKNSYIQLCTTKAPYHMHHFRMPYAFPHTVWALPNGKYYINNL